MLRLVRRFGSSPSWGAKQVNHLHRFRVSGFLLRASFGPVSGGNFGCFDRRLQNGIIITYKSYKPILFQQKFWFFVSQNQKQG